MRTTPRRGGASGNGTTRANACGFAPEHAPETAARRAGLPYLRLDEVCETVEHLRQNGELPDGAQPIVIIVKQRMRRRASRLTKMWGLG